MNLKVGHSAMGRVFVVGCPRAGTTLMQSLLAAHSAVHTFPESHFFTRGFGGSRWDKLRHRLQGGRWFCSLLQEFRDALAMQGQPVPELQGDCHSRRDAVAGFVTLLDETTLRSGKGAWVEKTPMHLDHIPTIIRSVPGARFIHIVRDGRANVASLYAVTRAYPEVWGGPRPLERCIEQWNVCIGLTRRFGGRGGHLVVHYDALVADPEGQMRRVCDHLNLPFEEQMLVRYRDAVALAIGEGEAWKGRNDREIRSEGLVRYEALFDEPTRAVIERQLNCSADSEVRHLAGLG